MKNLILIAGMLVLFSCKKNENKFATVNFNIQTKSTSGSLGLNQYTNFDDTTQIRFELIKLYLSKITFISSEGAEEVSEIVLIDLNSDGFASFSVKVPPGEYTQLKIGIGVPDYLNESDPSLYADDADHPLNTTQNTYWGMNGMYRFVMIDGKYDTYKDGTDDGAFSYHTGYDDSYRTLTIDKSFNFDKKENYSYSMSIDATKFFNVSGSEINIFTESNYHGDLGSIDLAIRLSDNFINAITFE